MPLLIGLVIAISIGAKKLLPILEAARKKTQETQQRIAKAAEAPPPLTEKQKSALETFGQDLAKRITDGDTAALARIQDLDAIADRVIHSLDGAIPAITEFREGFMSSVRTKAGGIFMSALKTPAKMVKVTEIDGFPTVMLRVLPEGGGVNFLGAMVRPDGDSFRVIDAYNYLFGLTVTEESARGAIAMAPTASGTSFAKRLLGLKAGQQGTEKDVMAILSDFGGQKFASVVDRYSKLPKEVQDQRNMFVIYLQCLMGLNGDSKYEPAYKAALGEARRILGKNSAVEMLLVDLYFLEEDYAAAEKAIASMDEVVGKDAYLEFLAGTACALGDDLEGALRHAALGRKLEPDMPSLVDLMLTIHAKKKDYRSLVDELRAFKHTHGITIKEDSLTEPMYVEFLKSPEFAAWKKENEL